MDLILNMFVYFASGLFLLASTMYCWNKMCDIFHGWNLLNISELILFMCFIETIFNFFLPKSLKFIFTFVFLIIIAYHFLDRKIVKAITIVAISQLVILSAEYTYVIIGHYMFGYELSELNKLSLSAFGGVILNLYTAVISILILKTGVPIKMYNIVDSLYNYNNRKDAIFYSALMISIAIISTVESWMNLPMMVVLTTNTILTLVFVYMVVKFANSENNYNQMNIKYRTSLSSLREYGDMINKYRITNHENQNQLLTIQNMTDDENVIRYIESLLKEKKNTNNKIMNKIIKIPEGEVRSLIHAKLSKINELGIKYKLDISKDVKTTSLIDLNDDLKRDTCTILGVFLDNAIEGVKDLKKRRIIIEFYIMDNFLYIDITNNFEGTIDAESLSNIGYTTKGEGHGYGLTLVDKIVKDNNDIEHECEIIKDNITQRVIIKM